MQSWHSGTVGQGAQRLSRNRACIRPRSLLTPKQGRSFLPEMGWTLMPHAESPEQPPEGATTTALSSRCPSPAAGSTWLPLCQERPLCL